MNQDEKIKQILLRESYVSEDDIKKAEEYAKTHNTSIISYLLTSEIISKNLLGQAIAEAFNLQFADLETKKPTQEQVLHIPEEVAKKHRIVLYGYDQHNISLATDTPTSNLEYDLSKIFAGRIIHIYYSFPANIDAAFQGYRQPLVSRLAHILQSPTGFAPGIIEEIVKEALTQKASDIHFEPQEDSCLIRLRIDGVLHQVGRKWLISD